MITRDSATRAALEVIDHQGLDGFSLDLVARRLGVRAPSLYHHFKDKAELLAEVARFVMLDFELPTDGEPVSWEEAMVAICIVTRRALLKHPNASPLFLQFFPRHLMLAAYDRWIGACPYPVEVQMILLEGTEKLTYASALFEAAARSRGLPTMPAFDPTRLPNLGRAMAANPFDAEGVFEQTIRTYLAGFGGKEAGGGAVLAGASSGRLRVRVKALREPAE
ncbi:MAG: TetR/AcrR family transcriptional regulator [Caulobacter sp.]|jgi:AcrR family transcriptional regulator|nr:TetR/AcrR family transcriptional regulator [Caulobacter sp.]